MQEVRVNIQGTINLRLADLNSFQEDIKILTNENYEKLKEEILQEGFSFSPHVFLDGEGKAWLLDGHQRRTCLERMENEGYSIPTIPCTEVSADSLEHARRLVLGGTSQYGTFQVKKLVEFTARTGIGGEDLLKRFVLPTVKFEKLVNVSGYLRGSGIDEEVIPPKIPRTKLGQIYKLGSHRLMCGDSTEPKNFNKLLDGKKAAIAITSPPYNSAGKIAQRIVKGVKKSIDAYEGYSDDLESHEYVDFAQKVLGLCIDHTAKFVFWNVNYNANSKADFIRQIVPHLAKLEETICWHKRVAIAIPAGLVRRWEPIFVFRGTDAPKRISVGGDESNYWDITTGQGNTENHCAAFPIALVERALQLTNAKSVLDPFGGTGTTLIAAEKLNSKCFMMELSPNYCDAIVERWEKFTGQKAEAL